MTQRVYIHRESLSKDFRDAQILQGKIHSVFHRVINLSFIIAGETRIITLIGEKIPLLPDSITVPDEIFSMLGNQHKCGIIKYKDTICFGEILLLLCHPANAELLLPDKVYRGSQELWFCNIKKLNQFKAPEGKQTDIVRLPPDFRRAAVSFADGYIMEKKKQIEEAYIALVGAGRGLTPSCDDAMLGIMAGACTWLSVKDGEKGKDRFLELSCGMGKDLLQKKRTTDISCKYLKCACRGRFSILLCNMLEWAAFAGREDNLPDELVMSISDIGHTSGMDMLFGLKIFCEEAVRCIG